MAKTAEINSKLLISCLERNQGDVSLQEGLDADQLVAYLHAIKNNDLTTMSSFEKEHGKTKLLEPFGASYQYLNHFNFSKLLAYTPLCVAAENATLEVVEYLVSDVDRASLQALLRTTRQTVDSTPSAETGKSPWNSTPLHSYQPFQFAAHHHNTAMLTYLLALMPREERDAIRQTIVGPVESSLSIYSKETVGHTLQTVEKALVYANQLDTLDSLTLYGTLTATAKEILDKEPFNALPPEIWAKIIGEKGLDAINQVLQNKPDASNAEKKICWAEYMAGPMPDNVSIPPSLFKKTKDDNGQTHLTPSSSRTDTSWGDFVTKKTQEKGTGKEL